MIDAFHHLMYDVVHLLLFWPKFSDTFSEIKVQCVVVHINMDNIT